VNADHPATRPNDDRPPSDPAPVGAYEIRVRGRLDPRWSTWFDGLALRTADDGTTVISGPVADQAALHGLLQRLRDLGLTLLSLRCASADDPTERPLSPSDPTPDPTRPPGATS